MAESIVKIPSAEAQGLDFLAFSFNGKHSWDDFHIYRVINGDRYEENLSPTLTDKTAEVPGGDGMYYFGTTHKQKEFNISFAFDHLTEIQLREMKKWLNGKEMGDLWFSEAPYKVWSAKPTGNSSVKYIPFDELNEQGNTVRIYKGEGSVQFIAYWPYAHTPDAIVQWDDNEEKYVEVGSGKKISSYEGFSNRGEWEAASGLMDEAVCQGENFGDLPAPFVLTYNGPLLKNTVFSVGEKEIILGEDCPNLKWDSKTGLVTKRVGEKDIPINFSGDSLASIPIEGNEIAAEFSADKFEELKITAYKEGDLQSEEYEEFLGVGAPRTQYDEWDTGKDGESLYNVTAELDIFNQYTAVTVGWSHDTVINGESQQWGIYIKKPSSTYRYFQTTGMNGIEYAFTDESLSYQQTEMSRAYISDSKDKEGFTYYKVETSYQLAGDTKLKIPTENICINCDWYLPDLYSTDHYMNIREWVQQLHDYGLADEAKLSAVKVNKEGEIVKTLWQTPYIFDFFDTDYQHIFNNVNLELLTDDKIASAYNNTDGNPFDLYIPFQQTQGYWPTDDDDDTWYYICNGIGALVSVYAEMNENPDADDPVVNQQIKYQVQPYYMLENSSTGEEVIYPFEAWEENGQEYTTQLCILISNNDGSDIVFPISFGIDISSLNSDIYGDRAYFQAKNVTIQASSTYTELNTRYKKRKIYNAGDTIKKVSLSQPVSYKITLDSVEFKPPTGQFVLTHTDKNKQVWIENNFTIEDLQIKFESDKMPTLNYHYWYY